jgi:hypothetical protein
MTADPVATDEGYIEEPVEVTDAVDVTALADGDEE